MSGDPFSQLQHLTAANFSPAGNLINSRGLVYIVFYGNGCPHCHRYAPTFYQFLQQNGLKSSCVNTGAVDLRGVQFPYAVNGVPMTAIYVNGVPVGYISGAADLQRLTKSKNEVIREYNKELSN
jgi:thiol-disulfide isomerase/thioredoxin